MSRGAFQQRLNWLIDRCSESEESLRVRAGTADDSVHEALRARRALAEELEQALHDYGGRRERIGGLPSFVRRASLGLVRFVRRPSAQMIEESDRHLARDYERACEYPLPAVVADVLLSHHRILKRACYRQPIAAVAARGAA